MTLQHVPHITDGLIVTIEYVKKLYHDWQRDSYHTDTPDLIIAFNAGIWGYPSWLDTISYIVCATNIPFAYTSYNIMEAEDSIDTITESDYKCCDVTGKCLIRGCDATSSICYRV